MTRTSSLSRNFALALLVLALCATTPTAASQKKSGKGTKSHKVAAATDLPPADPETVATVAEPTRDAETAPSEVDPQRTAWRLDATPFMVLGSGHPGKGNADFDKPDGLAFTADGKLLATDAKNRRIQVWDVKSGTRLGEFGHGIFGGQVVDIAVTPSGTVLVTDQVLNLAYAFDPPKPGQVDEDTKKKLGPTDYQLQGTKFGEQGFEKLGGIASDTKGRVYCVDAHRNEVRRFNPDFTPDASWHFEKARANGDTYLHGCEGIAIDEKAGDLYIASERDAAIQVFDVETGAYRHKLVGAGADEAGVPTGKHVFFGSVEGLALADGFLFAVDESAGHIQIFDVSAPGTFNTDLAGYPIPQVGRDRGYVGFVGHAPRVNFEDKNDSSLQKSVKEENIIPGQANPPGYFCSPDSIATYTDAGTGEMYVAVADQCNFRIAVYRWSDIKSALAKAKPGMGSAGTRTP